MGIEPTYPAWKAGVLPLNYTRMCYLIAADNDVFYTIESHLSTLIRKKIKKIQKWRNGRSKACRKGPKYRRFQLSPIGDKGIMIYKYVENKGKEDRSDGI
jgi:hypothetical protein